MKKENTKDKGMKFSTEGLKISKRKIKMPLADAKKARRSAKGMSIDSYIRMGVKIMAVVTALILIASLVFLVIGKMPVGVFWIIVILSALNAYLIIPRIRKKKLK